MTPEEMTTAPQAKRLSPMSEQSRLVAQLACAACDVAENKPEDDRWSEMCLAFKPILEAAAAAREEQVRVGLVLEGPVLRLHKAASRVLFGMGNTTTVEAALDAKAELSAALAALNTGETDDA